LGVRVGAVHRRARFLSFLTASPATTGVVIVDLHALALTRRRTIVGIPAGGVSNLRGLASRAPRRRDDRGKHARCQPAHRCASDFTRKTRALFVIADVSWRFS
jgi:hypothetical protein